MEKIVTVLWRPDGVAKQPFADALLQEVEEHRVVLDDLVERGRPLLDVPDLEWREVRRLSGRVHRSLPQADQAIAV